MKLTLDEQINRYKGLMNITEGMVPDKSLTRMNAGDKHKYNKPLHRLMEPTYFKDIPLDEIFNLLKEMGLVPLQEDQTEWEGMLTGESSHTVLRLGYTRSGKLGNNNIMTYVEIENAGLSLSWHKMGSGKVEVLAYIS